LVRNTPLSATQRGDGTRFGVPVNASIVVTDGGIGLIVRK